MLSGDTLWSAGGQPPGVGAGGAFGLGVLELVAKEVRPLLFVAGRLAGRGAVPPERRVKAAGVSLQAQGAARTFDVTRIL